MVAIANNWEEWGLGMTKQCNVTKQYNQRGTGRDGNPECVMGTAIANSGACTKGSCLTMKSGVSYGMRKQQSATEGHHQISSSPRHHTSPTITHTRLPSHNLYSPLVPPFLKFISHKQLEMCLNWVWYETSINSVNPLSNIHPLRTG